MSENTRIFSGISPSKELEVLAAAAKIGQRSFGIPAAEYSPAKLKESIRDRSLHILIRTSLYDACAAKDVAFSALILPD
ncbi:MAG: hypothetical protein KGH53_02410 [Candidatus Micrarchaeota archaeon]|nr:hypothetical protein [Candidatus Micrarchaeota archaeon]